MSLVEKRISISNIALNRPQIAKQRVGVGVCLRFPSRKIRQSANSLPINITPALIMEPDVENGMRYIRIEGRRVNVRCSFLTQG